MRKFYRDLFSFKVDPEKNRLTCICGFVFVEFAGFVTQQEGGRQK